MPSRNTIQIDITATDNASGVFDSVGGNMQSFGRGLQKTGVSLMALGAPILGIGIKSLQSFGASEKVAAQMAATIRSTGGAAGMSQVEMMGYANTMQNVTEYSDETVASGENVLLTFTNVGKDVFPTAMNAALDLSTAMGQDLQTSVMQIGKAIDKPAEGMDSLTRAGIRFTDAQKDQIKAMVASGDTMGAQQIILQALQEKFGGSAIAAGQTFPGQLAIMNNKIDDSTEKIGGALAPALGKIMEKLTPIIDGVTEWISKNPDLVIGVGAVALGATVLGGVFTILGTIISVGGTLLTGVGALIGFLTGPVGLVVLIGALVAAAVVGYPGGLPKLLSDAATSFKQIVGIVSMTFLNWIKDLGNEFHNLAIFLGMASDAKSRWNKGGDISSGGGGIDYGGGGSGGGSRGFHDYVGPGTANTPYMIGKGAQPELFIPSTSGFYIPNFDKVLANMTGNQGSTINLSIYANSASEGKEAGDAAIGVLDEWQSRGNR